MQNRQGWNRRITRRQLTRLSLAGLGSAMITSATAAMGRAAPDSEFDKSEFDKSEFDKSKFGQPVNAKRPKILGTTFSPLQCHYIGLDYQETFRWVCGLGLDRIRLCAYWHEIEPRPNQFDFSVLDRLLEECDRYGIEAILAVGMKVPRWPEFHFPDWLQAQYNTKGRPEPMDRDRAIAELTLRFTEKVVSHTRMAPALKYWQVENEPFTHLEITGGRYLSTEFVQQEVALVRALARADQKIALTGAIELPGAWNQDDDRAFQDCLRMADAVGINVYTKVPVGPMFYLEPNPLYWRRLKQWQTTLVASGKEDWIAEAQAEPWEHNQLVATNKLDHPSSSPKQTTNLVSSLSRIGYSTVLLWGCEYWYWQKQKGRNLWWWSVKQLVQG
jgi:hypothetical protein